MFGRLNMTDDIPEMYLAEALRRFNAAINKPSWTAHDYSNNIVVAHAATLQELGWTPPIDEARMAKARKVAAAVLIEAAHCGWAIKAELDAPNARTIQAAYDALGED